MPLGVHTSIAGGLASSIDRALELGCDAMQIFGRNPRSWAYKPVSAIEAGMFREKRKASGIWPVAVHTNYLINLSTPNEIIYDKSVKLFKNELLIAETIGADYLVTHLGSPQDFGDEYAIMRILEALKDVAASNLGKKTSVLLENTAGAGYGFGSKLADIGRIIKGAKALGVSAGLCFDTCHAFAAGYKLSTPEEARTLASVVEKEAGKGSLKMIHLNDSKGELGSNLDRHEHIGKGKIGRDGLGAFINHPKIKDVPLILETPKKSPSDDPANLRAVRELRKGLKIQA